MKIPDLGPERWRDLPQNPLISPPEGTSVIGDPQVILPGELDEQWHMFITGEGHLYLHRSTDGIAWERERTYEWRAATCFLLRSQERWLLYYAAWARREGVSTVLACRSSDDLEEWGEETVLLAPETDWEREGPRKQVRNPCVLALPDGRYRLYYSGGTIWLDDCGYEEPKYIGAAEADSPAGPFERLEGPVLGPDPKKPYRNFGAGAMKVFPWEGGYLGRANGRYRDERGRSGSGGDLLGSDDGLAWTDAPFNPILPPTTGWKHALVYQLDMVRLPDRLRVYYNAREGWAGTKEFIGASEAMLEGEGQ